MSDPNQLARPDIGQIPARQPLADQPHADQTRLTPTGIEPPGAHHVTDRVRSDRIGGRPLLLALGAGVATLAIGYAVLSSTQQNRVAHRPGDDAPARTARPSLAGRLSPPPFPVGRTITVNRPRTEVFAFWDDFANLSRFMQNIDSVTVNGDIARWQVSAAMGRSLTIETRVTARIEGERLAWQSTPGSDVKAQGQVTFRDAPAGRGTEIEAELSYPQAFGEIGRIVGMLFQTDPALQGRRDLRRFKMLMETGEIATNRNHHEGG